MPSVDYLKRLRDLELEVFQAAKDLTESEDAVEGSEEYEHAVEVMRIINEYSVLMHTEMFKKYGMNYHSKFNK